MWLFRKNTADIVFDPPFVAAYSELAFTEAKNSAKYPDYSFHSVGGMNWCVRVGEITVPWGFSARDAGFSSNGVFVVSRANVSAATFDQKGFSYVKKGEVYYLYENEMDDGGSFYGFSVYMRNLLLPELKKFAKEHSGDYFARNIDAFLQLDEVNKLLSAHRLKLVAVRINNVV